jgi:hypothetical protein
MILFIQMTWENGGNICGYYCSVFCRKMGRKEKLHRGSYETSPCSIHGISNKSKIIHRMADFPRWSDLKHFNNVTTTHFTDGQAFYDILKVSFFFFASRQVVKFTFLVHSALYCGFPSEKLGLSTLHPCLPPVSNPCWPSVHD